MRLAHHAPGLALACNCPGWKAVLPVHEAGGNFSITASCRGCEQQTDTNISDVAVWDCALPLSVGSPLRHQKGGGALPCGILGKGGSIACDV